MTDLLLQGDGKGLFFLRPRWGTVLPDLAQLRENGASGTPSRAFWKCLRALRKKPKIWRILNIVKLYYRLILVPTLKFPKLQYFFDILGWRIFWRISTIFSRILTNFSRILTKILWQQWWGRRKVETRGGEMGVFTLFVVAGRGGFSPPNSFFGCFL